MMKSNAEWLLWGRLDPLWAVASWRGKKKDSESAWTDEEFYDLGADFADFDRVWSGVLARGSSSVLEIGCGAGRITNRLAGVFDHVVASDISPDMLTYAKQHVTAGNIAWKLSDGDKLPAGDCSMTAVFSCHVFQHFSSRQDQLSAFREVFRVLAPGGTFFVHLPMYVLPKNKAAPLMAAVQRSYESLIVLKAAVRRLMVRLANLPYMHGTYQDADRLMAELAAIGFTDLGVSIVKVGTNGDNHTCIYGRKPG
jgi:ubiquinone/menaquinone biosynthesis C-methylase UbiE